MLWLYVMWWGLFFRDELNNAIFYISTWIAELTTYLSGMQNDTSDKPIILLVLAYFVHDD